MVHQWIMDSGRWLTKRRGILLAPLFTVALVGSRWAHSLRLEWAQDLAGVACLLVGSRLRFLAASYHECEQDSDSSPLTAGPYAWVRHPLYLANFLVGLGIVLLTGWWPMILFYCLFFLPTHALIARSEEIHLTHLYGQKYELYRRTVPALIPWRRYRGVAYGTSNPIKIRSGKEWLKNFGYLAGATGILAVKEYKGLFIVPAPHPLSILLWLFWVCLILLIAILRPKTRRSWIRHCEMALVIAAAFELAIHLPGVV